SSACSRSRAPSSSVGSRSGIPASVLVFWRGGAGGMLALGFAFFGGGGGGTLAFAAGTWLGGRNVPVPVGGVGRFGSFILSNVCVASRLLLASSGRNGSSARRTCCAEKGRSRGSLERSCASSVETPL